MCPLQSKETLISNVDWWIYTKSVINKNLVRKHQDNRWEVTNYNDLWICGTVFGYTNVF